MRKVNVTIFALVAVCLVVAPLAFGQGGNPPAVTNQSGTTSGHRATVEDGRVWLLELGSTTPLHKEGKALL